MPMARLGWNEAPRLAALAALAGGRTEGLARNMYAGFAVEEIGGTLWPVTTTEGGANCYLVDGVTAYVDYALAETRNLHAHPALRATVRGLIRAARPLVRATGLDRQVQVNNWLFSTCPVPPVPGAVARALAETLVPRHPRHALVIRSLNAADDAASLAALGAEGWILLPARQVWRIDPKAAEAARPRDLLADQRLTDRCRFPLIPAQAFTAEDFTRAAGLYDQLYRQKYPALNPAYTPAFLQGAAETGLIDLAGWRGPDGDLVALSGLFRNGATLTQPILGYDLARPQREGLYRLAVMRAHLAARDQGLLLNASAGAARFKRLRGATPAIEWTAVFAAHLPARQRAALATLRGLLVAIGVPLMRRMRL
jgi:hypothetical protein